MTGYSYDKDSYLRRLRRIEGQVRVAIQPESRWWGVRMKRAVLGAGVIRAIRAGSLALLSCARDVEALPARLRHRAEWCH